MSDSGADNLEAALEAALEAIQANEAQQRKLTEYVQGLRASLQEADSLMAEVEKSSTKEKDVIEFEEDAELKVIEVKGAIKFAMSQKYWNNPKSPFYEAAMRRQQYLSQTKPRPWTPVERRFLKQAVVNEHKRAYALELKSQGHQDVLSTVKARSDADFETSDASSLDWENLSKKFLNMLPTGSTPRSAMDCRIQWLNCDHPKLKKGPWLDDEVIALTAAISDLQVQPVDGDGEDMAENDKPTFPKVDWVAVSKRIGGTRSPVQCYQYWLSLGDQGLEVDPVDDGSPEESDADDEEDVTFGRGDNEVSTPPSRDGHPVESHRPADAKVQVKRPAKPPKIGSSIWSPEEDEILAKTVATYGTANWTLVASKLPFARSGRQCSDRYRLSVDPNIRRAKWTEEEDTALRKAVATLGTKWHLVKDYVHGRTGPQCRERWVNVVDPELKKDDWTAEEDDKIIALRSEGKEWPVIAKEIGGRTDNQVWRRHKWLQSKRGSSKAAKAGKLSKTRATWSSEEDQRLQDAKLQGLTWRGIADSFADGRTAQQCSSRWRRLQDTQGNDLSQAVDAEKNLGQMSENEEEREVTATPKPRPRPRPRPKAPKLPNEGTHEPSAEASSSRTSKKRKDPPEATPSEIEDGAPAATQPTEKPILRSGLRKRAKVDYSLGALAEESDVDPGPGSASRRRKPKGKGKAVVPAEKLGAPAVSTTLVDEGSGDDVPVTL